MSQEVLTRKEISEHVCPHWVGYLLANPLRKLRHNPRKILMPYVKEGMKVADVGCAMGFFSFPMQEMVTEKGQVDCYDLQESMLSSLNKRIVKKRKTQFIKTYRTSRTQIGLRDSYNFILAFAVVHEVPDQKKFLSEIKDHLGFGARVLISEPKEHVSFDDFEKTKKLALENGMIIESQPSIPGNYSIVLAVKR